MSLETSLEPLMHHDSCDFEVDSHISYFLERLPETLYIERVLRLTLENPTETLSVLLEVREALVQERRKAEVLLRLKEMQNAGERRARMAAEDAQTGYVRHSELL